MDYRIVSILIKFVGALNAPFGFQRPISDVIYLLQEKQKLHEISPDEQDLLNQLLKLNKQTQL